MRRDKGDTNMFSTDAGFVLWCNDLAAAHVTAITSLPLPVLLVVEALGLAQRLANLAGGREVLVAHRQTVNTLGSGRDHTQGWEWRAFTVIKRVIGAGTSGGSDGVHGHDRVGRSAVRAEVGGAKILRAWSEGRRYREYAMLCG